MVRVQSHCPCGEVGLAVTALQLWAFPRGYMKCLTQPYPGWAKERALGISLFSHVTISTVRTLLTLTGNAAHLEWTLWFLKEPS